MRGLLIVIAVVAIVLIGLGLVLEALKWLIILGLIALVASIVVGVIHGRKDRTVT
jgi:hypothetical protein